MRKNARGQATTETILLTWLLITLIAAMYQIFLANDAVYRSLTIAHQRLFIEAFDRNCWSDSDACTYSSSLARVIWTPAAIAEVRVPRVGLFEDDLGEPRLYSNKSRYALTPDEDCPDLPCKRTRTGSGTYMNPWDALGTSIAGLPEAVSDLADIDFGYLAELLVGVIDQLLDI